MKERLPGEPDAPRVGDAGDSTRLSDAVAALVHITQTTLDAVAGSRIPDSQLAEVEALLAEIVEIASAPTEAALAAWTARNESLMLRIAEDLEKDPDCEC